MPNKPTSKRKPWHQERKQHQRSVDNSEFYNSRTWRGFRAAYLLKNPLCVHCKQEGVLTEATVVDHVVRIADGGAKLDENNMQSLCKKHHNRKSGKESHGYRQASKGGMG